MPSREVKAVFTADEKGFTRGAASAHKEATKLSQVLEKMGPVGRAFNGLLDKIGLGSISAGAGLAGGLTAAIGVSTAFVEKAIEKYVELGEKIRAYAAITGQSAEASSRQVQAFQELGVSEDVAQLAMFRLGKAAETNQAKLEALGVRVQRDANGNLDLNATLLGVIDAFHGTADAGRRAEIIFAAFGRGGQALLPVLESNSAELKRLEDQIGLVYTADDLKRVRDYKIAQNQLQQSWTELTDQIGAFFLPMQKAVIDGENRNIYINNKLAASQEYQTAVAHHNRGAVQLLAQAYGKEWDEAQTAREKTDSLAASQSAAAKRALDEANAEDALYASLNKVSDASDALKDAQFRLRHEQYALSDAYAAYAKAAKEHGKNSREAREALLAYQEAQQALVEQYRKVAEAEVAAAESQAEAAGGSLTAAQKADIYRASLQKLASSLGANDPLRKALQAYIDELGSIPSAVHTKIEADYTRPGGKHSKVEAFAKGGVVGGSAADHPVMASNGEGVFTPEQMAALPDLYAGGGSGRAIEVHLHVNGVIVGTAYEVSKMLARELRNSGAFKTN